MTPTIEIAEFASRHADGGFVVDVREAAEYVEGHVPGAVLAPVSMITRMLGSIPKDRKVHVICASGNRSLAMTDLLIAQGYDAVSVNGGTSGWRAAGHPVVTGTNAG